jgi:hypothetical protein
MGTTKAFAIAAILALLAGPVAAFGADPVAQAQTAVAEAEKKLQLAIDTNSRVVAARRKLEQARAKVDESINSDPAVFKAASQRYEQAQAEEQAAVNAAAPGQRAALAQRQKELLALKETPPAPPGDVQKNAVDPKAADEPPAAVTQRAGDVEVRLLHARVAPVSYTGTGSTTVRTSDPLLGVLIEVKNLGKEPIEYVGWNSNAFATDGVEKQYLPAGVAGGTVLGRVVSQSLPPGASARDLIVLQRAPERKELTITLPGFNVGGSGAIQFHVGADKVEFNNTPLVDRSTPSAPRVVQEPRPQVTTQPAGPPGSWGRSTDGVEFPAVVDPGAKKDRLRPVARLPDVCNLLMYPPGKLNFPVYSVEKSGAKLTEPMSHAVAIPGTRARGVTKATRIDVDQLDPACQFFALGVANAAVAGFEVRNGVVARIVLYYKRTDAAQRMLLVSYGQAPQSDASPKAMVVEVGPWTCRNANGGNVRDKLLKRDVWPVVPQESPATIEVDVNAMKEYGKPAK